MSTSVDSSPWRQAGKDGGVTMSVQIASEDNRKAEFLEVTAASTS